MPKTITGAQFRDFYQNHWPAGCWHEDAEYEIEDDNGNWLLPDDRILELGRLGYVVRSEDGRDVWTDFSEVWETWSNESPPIRVMTWRVPAELSDEVETFMAEREIERVGDPKNTPTGEMSGPS